MKKIITMLFLVLFAAVTGCFDFEDEERYSYVNLEIDGQKWNLNSNNGTFNNYQAWIFSSDWSCAWTNDDNSMNLEITCYNDLNAEADLLNCDLEFIIDDPEISDDRQEYFSHFEFEKMITSWNKSYITSGLLSDCEYTNYTDSTGSETIECIDGSFKVEHDTQELIKF